MFVPEIPLFRLEPGIAHRKIDLKRDPQFGHLFHLLFNQLPELLDFRVLHFENKLIMDLRDEFTFEVLPVDFSVDRNHGLFNQVGRRSLNRSVDGCSFSEGSRMMVLATNPQEFRRHAKVINFGIMYGLSAFGLAQSLKITRNEAQQFIDNYFKKYQGVKTWIDQTLAEVHETGYVRTLFGRIRPIPEIRSKNHHSRTFAERTAINAPIQGTAADLIKKAMVSIDGEIYRQNLKSKLISQVHDELVFEVENSEVEKLRKLVKEQMEEVAELRVPLQVDLAVGNSWFEAK